MFTKLGRDEVLIVPYKVLLFFVQIRPGLDPGRGKNRSGGPFSNELLLQTGRLPHQTECIAMIYKHVGWSIVTFGSIKNLRSQFFTRFRHLFWLIFILPYFNAISCRFLCSKVFNLHFFGLLSMFIIGRMLIQKI